MAQPQEAYAGGEARIIRGLARTVLSVFEIPKSIIQHSSRVIFPVGILTGTVEGTMKMALGTVAGVIDMATGAAPYAKYGLLFI